MTNAQKGAHPMTTPRQRPESEPLLTPSEVATLFRVDPKTVTRWAKAGKLTSIRTLGGHRRYRESEVRSLLEGNTHATVERLSLRLHVRSAAPSDRCGVFAFLGATWHAGRMVVECK